MRAKVTATSRRAFLFSALAAATVAALAAEPLPRLQVSANRHYLEWHGRPILPIGDSVTHGWMELGTDFDQQAYLDALAARGLNAVLVWSYIGTCATAQQQDRRVGYDSHEVWPWQGSPDARSIDLTAFNEAYFERLHGFVRYAEDKGIIVMLTVQDGWTKTRFGHHPFNAALGNGPLTEGRQFVELHDVDHEMPIEYRPDWTWQQRNQFFQEQYAAKLCAVLGDCGNVIYEMLNEGEWYDPELRRRHEEHFLGFFRRRTSALLMTNADHVRSNRYTPRRNPAVDIVSLHKQPWTGHYRSFVDAFRAVPTRVIIESEPVPAIGGLEPAQSGQPLTTPEIVRSTVWERALAGAGFVAQNDTSFAWASPSALVKQASLRDQVYNILGHAARFFNHSGVAFWEMEPHPEFASTGRCLALPGVEYVVYAPQGGTFYLDLAAATGRALSVRWLNPSTGALLDGIGVDGGAASAAFTPPFGGDAVLRLWSGAAGARSAADPASRPAAP